jgi:2-oxoglutarate ferredoxin oxidoreductase subunit alpha
MTEFPEWATIGKKPGKERKRITSLNLIPLEHEKHNQKLQAKYRQMEAEEIRYEEYLCQDAEYIMVAYGASARIASRAVEMARAKGIRVGLFRPVTLFPFPAPRLRPQPPRQGILSIEMSAGQMIEDIRLAVGRNHVWSIWSLRRIVHVPEEILEAFERFY